MKILITGGAGFIGSRLALNLIARGHDITVLDNLLPQVHTDTPERSDLYLSIKDKVRLVQGCVTDREAWMKVLDGQEAIVHFAAETGTGQSMYQIEHYNRVNIGGTAIMLDILANQPHSVRRIVVASSRSIYGEGKYLSREMGAVYPVHRSAEAMKAGDFQVSYPGCSALELAATCEDSKIHPSSVYGITKQVQEQLVMTVCPGLGIEPVAFRYQNVYGPGQSLTNPYTGILSIFSNQMMAGKPINIFEDGDESRDFVFVDDVVEATTLGIERPEAAGEVFNVGTGVPVTVMQVANSLKKLIGADVPISVTGNFRLGDIRHNYADMTKAKRLLDFTPKVDFETGIARFVQWAMAQGAQDSDYQGSLEEMKRKGLMK